MDSYYNSPRLTLVGYLVDDQRLQACVQQLAVIPAPNYQAEIAHGLPQDLTFLVIYMYMCN